MNPTEEIRKLANSLRKRESNIRTANKKSYYGDYPEQSDSDEETQKRFNSFVQWTTSDGDTFFPAGRVAKQLPPGYYDIGQTMTGEIYFKKKQAKAEQLLRFPDSASDKVIANIESFWDLEDKFVAAGIPYRRGIALYGPPGSGKTCILRIAIDNLVNKRAGVVVDFPGPHLMHESYRVLRQIHANMPLVVLMEDLDSILDRHMESDVLNLLDGVTDIRKAVFLATTNYPERLGSRILNRPSRFDQKYYVGMPNREAREMYLRTKLDDEKEIQKWADDTEDFSIAHLKELFVANKIFGDDYTEALNVLTEMSSTPSSKLFDRYDIKMGEEPVKARGANRYMTVKDLEKFQDNSWSMFGSGEPYKMAKKAFSERKR